MKRSISKDNQYISRVKKICRTNMEENIVNTSEAYRNMAVWISTMDDPWKNLSSSYYIFSVWGSRTWRYQDEDHLYVTRLINCSIVVYWSPGSYTEGNLYPRMTFVNWLIDWSIDWLITRLWQFREPRTNALFPGGNIITTYKSRMRNL